MWNTTKIALSLTLVLAAITIVVAGFNKTDADIAVLPNIDKPGNEVPVRATKGDRQHIGTEVRAIEGVTLVLRDMEPAVR